MKRFGLGCAVLVAACSLPNVGLWSAHGKADTGLYSLYGTRIAHELEHGYCGFGFRRAKGLRCGALDHRPSVDRERFAKDDVLA